MRVLITGGNGYLGGRLAQFLASQEGCEILLGSRQQAGSSSWLPRAMVAQTQWDSLPSLEQTCMGVDAIVHLAGMNAQDSLADPVAALEVGVVATARLLQAAVRQEVKRFIYISTAHIYGSPLTGCIDEETLPRPRHPYAISHLAAEDVVLAAHDEGQLTGVVLRLSNGFGVPAHPGVNCWTLLVNDLCRQAVTDHCLVLRSTGSQRRDFVTMHNVVRAVAHMIDLPRWQVGNGIFNVGGRWAPQVFDFARIIQARCSTVLGVTPKIVCPEAGSSEVVLDLEYRINKLSATGFVLMGDPVTEIDATLRLCRAARSNA